MYHITGRSRYRGLKFDTYRTNWSAILVWFSELRYPKDAYIEIFDEKGRCVASKDFGFCEIDFGVHYYAECDFEG